MKVSESQQGNVSAYLRFYCKLFTDSWIPYPETAPGKASDVFKKGAVIGYKDKEHHVKVPECAFDQFADETFSLIDTRFSLGTWGDSGGYRPQIRLTWIILVPHPWRVATRMIRPHSMLSRPSTRAPGTPARPVSRLMVDEDIFFEVIDWLIDMFPGALIPYDGGEKLIRVSFQMHINSSGNLIFRDRTTKCSAMHKQLKVSTLWTRRDRKSCKVCWYNIIETPVPSWSLGRMCHVSNFHSRHKILITL